MDPDIEQAYAAYVTEQWPVLVRAAVFLGAAPHEAEDLAQTTLVKCYREWPRVTGADNREAYVFRMLVNALRDARRSPWWRHRDRNRPFDGAREAVGAVVPDGAEARATADAVHRALGALSKPNREVVVLRYFVQLTEAQTARVLEIAPGTVKSRLSRALAQLATSEHLTELSGGPR